MGVSDIIIFSMHFYLLLTCLFGAKLPFTIKMTMGSLLLIATHSFFAFIYINSSGLFLKAPIL